MKRSTRWMSLVWLALVLNVLSPVIGYARDAAMAVANAPFTLELCSAAGAKRITIADEGGGDTSQAHGGVAHCVYCPGFAANVALGASAPALPSFVRRFVCERRSEQPTVFLRRGMRIAQPRAPPESSLT
ncbi:DUF2946 domain-containing protein [Burkholderia singularis]|nr:DUF2946 domain-containing protein [Burkholderia singularis]